MTSRSRLGETLLSILVVASISATDVFAAPRSRSAATQSAPQYEALPLVRSRQNHLLVYALINGNPAWLIVDTGAPGTVINLNRTSYFKLTNAPSKLNWPRRIHVNGGFSRLMIARSLRLGGLNIIDVPAVVADMDAPVDESATVTNEPQADGILGADVLLATRAVLDCQKQVLFLDLSPDQPGRVPGLDLRGLQRVRMIMSDTSLSYVDASVNGTPARLMVDTGAFVTLLHRPFVERLHIPTQPTQFESAALNLGEQSVKVARIRKLAIGRVDISGKYVGVVNLSGILREETAPSAPTHPARTPPLAGLLGAEILRSHHAIIDFGTSTLYLRARTDQPRNVRHSSRE